MLRKFVHTENAARFMDQLQALTRRGAAEACLMVIDGEPGHGKSMTAQWWAAQTGSAYLRAKREWSPSWMLRELLAALGIAPLHSFERMYRQALEALRARADEAVRGEVTYGVVIDEIDHVARNGALLETLRDLSDMLEIPFILVGMGRVRSQLARFPQVASRVGQYVEFARATPGDVEKIAKELVECPVDGALLAYLAKAADGRTREIMEGLQAIERAGKRKAGKPVTAADLKDVPLFNDRKTGRPVLARE